MQFYFKQHLCFFRGNGSTRKKRKQVSVIDLFPFHEEIGEKGELQESQVEIDQFSTPKLSIKDRVMQEDLA
jgi:hypothetical protein